MGPHYPRKRFGQNFLQDSYVVERIIGAFRPQKNQTIIEIGPGLGALTRPLAKQTTRLHVIEIDRDLSEKLSCDPELSSKLIIHNVDVLTFDFLPLGEQLRIIGNLPYNISTPLLFHLLKYAEIIQDMMFMLQEDVVDRICARTGNKSYGRLSVMLQSLCHIDKLFTVDSQSFNPRPKVSSAIVRIIPDLKKYHIPDRETFSVIVKQAFSQRRKTVRNSLKAMVNEKQLVDSNINPASRAENLTIEDFINITKTCLEISG